MNQEFDKIFEKYIFSSASNNNFILGLSGGADSICLLHLLKKFIENNHDVKINLLPIIVDHSLRKNSDVEAKTVKKYSEDLGFKTKIRRIKQNKPKGNIQNWARIHRRELLIEEAQKNNSQLLLAHHFDDQIETLFMRLIYGSGFSGLLGIKSIYQWDHIKIIRPLLKFKKEKILKYIQYNNLLYVEDPSNKKISFERVYTRKLMPLITKEIEKNLESKLEKLSIYSFKLLNVIERKIKSWIKVNVNYYTHGSISVNYVRLQELYNLSPKFTGFLVGKLINNVGGKYFLPRQKKIMEKLKYLFKNKINKFTLGNVVLFVSSNEIFLIREIRNLIVSGNIFKDKFHYFDKRFLITSKYEGEIVNSSLFNDKVVNLEMCKSLCKHEKYINKSLPLLKTLEGRLIKPYLNIIEKKNISDLKAFDNDFNLFFIKDTNFV